MSNDVFVLPQPEPFAIPVAYGVGGTTGAKGDPGGNVLAIGLFTAAAALSITVGTNLVETSGYSTDGQGGAKYVYDAAVDAAYVSAHPRTSFVSANSRGFKLSLDQGISSAMFGVVGGDPVNDPPAMLAAVAFVQANLGTNIVGYGSAAPVLHVPFYSQAIKMGANPVAIGTGNTSIRIKGAGGGNYGGLATVFEFAAGCNGFEIHWSNCGLEGIGILGPWVPNAGTLSEGSYHGIKAYYKFTYRDIWIGRFQGAGIYAHITAGSGGDTEGNVNTAWGEMLSIDSCTTGLDLAGADVNAGNFAGCNINYCRQAGIIANEFLGNTWPGMQIAGCGVTSEPSIPRCVAYNNGHWFYAVWGQETWCSTNSPPSTATNNQGWRYWKDALGATTYAPQWVTGQTWRAGGPYLFGQINGQGLLENPYAEGDMPPGQCAQNVLIIGGIHGGGLDLNTRYVKAQSIGVEVGPTLYLNSGGLVTPNLGGSFIQNFHLGEFRIDGSINGNTTDVLAKLKTGNLTNSIAFYASGGGQDGAITSSSSSSLFLHHKNGVVLEVNFTPIAYANATEFSPSADNVTKLGTAVTRWSTVYAGTGTINTSDGRLKTQVSAIDDETLDAWESVEWASFKHRDAVKAKGKDGARLHVGLVAQRVQKVFEDRGLDPFKLGLLCHDKWEDQHEPVWEDAEISHFDPIPNPKFQKQMERYLARKAEGKSAKRPTEPEHVLVEQKLTVRRHKLDEKGKPITRVAIAAGDRFGIRYEEALALEAAMQRRRADRMEKRLAVIEDRLGRAAARFA